MFPATLQKNDALGVVSACVHAQMKWAHDLILTSMREIFACFEGGSSEVKRERRALVVQTDSNIEVRSMATWKHGKVVATSLCSTGPKQLVPYQVPTTLTGNSIKVQALSGYGDMHNWSGYGVNCMNSCLECS